MNHWQILHECSWSWILPFFCFDGWCVDTFWKRSKIKSRNWSRLSLILCFKESFFKVCSVLVIMVHDKGSENGKCACGTARECPGMPYLVGWFKFLRTESATASPAVETFPGDVSTGPLANSNLHFQLLCETSTKTSWVITYWHIRQQKTLLQLRNKLLLLVDLIFSPKNITNLT